MSPVDPEQARFAQDFGPVFAAMRQARGECPPGDRLAAWVAGDAPDAERAQLGAHVAMCGRCDALVTRMRAVEQKLGRKPWWQFLRKPALGWAAALVIAVIAASYLRTGVRMRGSAPPPLSVRGFEAAQFVPLKERQRGEAQPAPIPGTARSVVLAFIVPAQPGYRYTARILPGTVQPSELSISPATGEAYVTIDRFQFHSGRYACVVTESDASGAPTGRTFEFPFAL
ncbi:MAG TPA: zf-HC2 domain-containing protein [Verrucomicrobiae bacterium]|nr:zf-HC2 domain-containing protein [Verrucomicrobiae bacterium]